VPTFWPRTLLTRFIPFIYLAFERALCRSLPNARVRRMAQRNLYQKNVADANFLNLTHPTTYAEEQATNSLPRRIERSCTACRTWISR